MELRRLDQSAHEIVPVVLHGPGSIGGRWVGTRPSAVRCSSPSLPRPPIASPAPCSGFRSRGPVSDTPSTIASLRTTVAGLPLRNPIGLAAGFDKRCAHLDALLELGFGYVVGGTITRAPRAGNAKPRIVRYPAKGSMTNAMGLPNPGAERTVAILARRARPAGPRLVSVADEAVEDAIETFSLLEPHADGVELNASCPNVSWGRDRDNEAHLRELVTAMRARSATPLFVKLPPFTTGVERDVVVALACIAQESGASGLTCSNTRPVRETRLSVGAGGLSGRALWERTPSIVAEVRAATGGGLADQRLRRHLVGGPGPGMPGGGGGDGAGLLGADLRGPGARRRAHERSRRERSTLAAPRSARSPERPNPRPELSIGAVLPRGAFPFKMSHPTRALDGPKREATTEGRHWPTQP